MPRSNRAPGKRPHSRKSGRVGKIMSLALDIEEPLNDAADFVCALRLIGQGIMLDDKGEGRAIAAAAWSASQRLEDLRAVWTKMLEAARRTR